jgi:nucleoside-diphosphate-sugar epimerase
MEESTSQWRGRRVLVTGCTGFLGAAVTAELLNQQAHVIGLIRDRNMGAMFAREREAGLFHLIHGRIENTFRIHSAVAIHEVSAIFHLAHESAEPKASSMPSEVSQIADDRGTAAVLRAAALHHPRLPVIVAKPVNQLRILNSDVERATIPHGIARFGELFGGTDRGMSRVVPRTIATLLARETGVAIEGSARDFVFIRDAARACLAVAEAVGSGSYPLDVTFRSGWELTEAEMTRVIGDVFAGRKPKVAFEETPANPFGWRPASSFDAAVTETIEGYRESARSRAETTRLTDPVRKAA